MTWVFFFYPKKKKKHRGGLRSSSDLTLWRAQLGQFSPFKRKREIYIWPLKREVVYMRWVSEIDKWKPQDLNYSVHRLRTVKSWENLNPIERGWHHDIKQSKMNRMYHFVFKLVTPNPCRESTSYFSLIHAMEYGLKSYVARKSFLVNERNLLTSEICYCKNI